MKYMLRVPFAHRGLHDMLRGPGQVSVPENSMAAFEAAVEAGYGIEFDVRLAADGEAVVFHDADLSRLAGLPAPVLAQDSAELARMRLCGTNETIPLLSDVLRMVDGRVPLYVEVKTEGVLGPLEERVRVLLRRYAGPFAVASFSPAVVGWFREHAPEMVRGLIATNRWQGRPVPPTPRHALLARLRHAPLALPDFVAYNIDGLPHPAVTRFRAQEGSVLAWTARTSVDMEKAARVADNVVFEGLNP